MQEVSNSLPQCAVDLSVAPPTRTMVECEIFGIPSLFEHLSFEAIVERLLCYTMHLYAAPRQDDPLGSYSDLATLCTGQPFPTLNQHDAADDADPNPVLERIDAFKSASRRSCKRMFCMPG